MPFFKYDKLGLKTRAEAARALGVPLPSFMYLVLCGIVPQPTIKVGTRIHYREQDIPAIGAIIAQYKATREGRHNE